MKSAFQIGDIVTYKLHAEGNLHYGIVVGPREIHGRKRIFVAPPIIEENPDGLYHLETDTLKNFHHNLGEFRGIRIDIFHIEDPDLVKVENPPVYRRSRK